MSCIDCSRVRSVLRGGETRTRLVCVPVEGLARHSELATTSAGITFKICCFSQTLREPCDATAVCEGRFCLAFSSPPTGLESVLRMEAR